MSFKGFARLILFLVAPMVCLAQLDTATILGTVTDSSGAVVAGAQVEVQNVGTSANVVLTSGADGVFIASTLPVGEYVIKASAKGFKSYTQGSGSGDGFFHSWRGCGQPASIRSAAERPSTHAGAYNRSRLFVTGGTTELEWGGHGPPVRNCHPLSVRWNRLWAGRF